MLKAFFRSEGGNLAILGALCMVPLILGMGMAVDYTRLTAARSRLQTVADAAALAVASSKETDQVRMRQMADAYVAANQTDPSVENVQIASLSANDGKVDIALSADVPLTFMRIARMDTMHVGVSALAMRAVTGSVEVALVLDNTYSMAELNANGVTKLASLKTAANALVTELMSNPDADVKIGLVPYADYVNVGTGYRYESWLTVPADYTVAAVPKSGCTTQLTEVLGACTAYAPSYDCSTYVDGVLKPKTCTGACTARKPSTWANKESCTTPAKAAQYFKWYGCIGSRNTGTYRLNDTVPTVTYPGYLDTSQKCLNPIVTLTTDKIALKGAIDGMVYSLGSYEPYTYIPAGLIWGINVLSPTAPLTEAASYDLANKVPRKALLLMTDGENTRRFQSSDGRHVAFSATAATAATQLGTVNTETLTLCTYAKSKNIEVYSVAFMVDDAAAKTMLEKCATDSDHYFDASDSAKLLAAFSGIAQSLSQVRLAR
ncbi:pilus assembly protein TadG-related protein [Mesorhizobium sp. ES1-1]|uniref:pilus assembly protein TadG-related protein n=1 Tax=Mesorhizobium sp. ES1-1 TaxID=2876629 RepID=UPI001CCFF11B|nr:pilus assembly protein TadG-related protein [Mesorhizobium sp. ES1-1]MBZ9676755.1 pilus assembly protein TadG-related protein [Mesorhizobium sp. ES1-1]